MNARGDRSIRIFLNEREISIAAGATVADLAARHRPQADVLVLNGFPVSSRTELSEGDHLVLFKRGERPGDDELWALVCARHSPGVAEKLKHAVVGIAGLGGLGSNIAVTLARLAVGRLVLVDFDVVEPTNINRQHYFLDQLGMKKTEALAATIERVSPFTKIERHDTKVDEDNVIELFDGCDVVVEAFDRAEAKVMLIETLHTARPELPIVAASGMAGYEAADLIETRHLGKLHICGDFKSEAAPGQGLMAPRVAVCANFQANQVLRILLGFDD